MRPHNDTADLVQAVLDAADAWERAAYEDTDENYVKSSEHLEGVVRALRAARTEPLTIDEAARAARNAGRTLYER